MVRQVFAAPELPDEPPLPELGVEEGVEPEEAGFSAGLDSVLPPLVSFLAACL